MLGNSESLERKEDGKVVLKLEEDADVTLETFDIFLTFIYSGRFKETRKTPTSVHFTWIDLLPQLVDLAQKVGNQESLTNQLCLLPLINLNAFYLLRL